MNELIKVTSVQPLGGHRLRLRFSDRTEGERDFPDIVARQGPMIEPLRDPAYFARVYLDHGVPTWPNGFDVDAIALHDDMRSHGLLRVPAA